MFQRRQQFFHVPELVLAFFSWLSLADVVVSGSVCSSWRALSRVVLSPRTLALLHPASRYSFRRIQIIEDILPTILAVAFAEDSSLLVVTTSHQGVVLIAYPPQSATQVLAGADITQQKSRRKPEFRRTLLLARHRSPGSSTTLYAQVCNQIIIIETFVFVVDSSGRVGAALDLKDVFPDSLIGAIHAAAGLVFVCFDSTLAVVKILPAPAASANLSEPRRGMGAAAAAAAADDDDGADEADGVGRGDALAQADSTNQAAEVKVLQLIRLDSQATGVWAVRHIQQQQQGEEDEDGSACNGSISQQQQQQTSFFKSSNLISVVVAHQSLSGTKLELLCSAADGGASFKRIGRSMVPLRFRHGCIDGKTQQQRKGSFSPSCFSPSAIFATVTFCGKLLTYDIGRVFVKRRQMILAKARELQRRSREKSSLKLDDDDGDGEDDDDGGGEEERKTVADFLEQAELELGDARLLEVAGAPSVFPLFAPAAKSFFSNRRPSTTNNNNNNSSFASAATANLPSERDTPPQTPVSPGTPMSGNTVLSLQIVSNSFCLAAVVHTPRQSEWALWLCSLDGTLLRSSPLAYPSLICSPPSKDTTSESGATVLVAVHCATSTSTPHPLAGALETGVADVMRFRSAGSHDHAITDHNNDLGGGTQQEEPDYFYVFLNFFGGVLTFVSAVLMFFSLIAILSLAFYYGGTSEGNLISSTLINGTAWLAMLDL